jgi:hypothetical protein
MQESIKEIPTVVGVLQKFRGLRGYKLIPIDLLSERINQPPDVIRTRVADLEKQHVVVVVGDKVRLRTNYD